MSLALRALLLIILALVPAGLVQIWMEREARGARVTQVGEEAMRLARLVAGQQSRTIEGAQQVLAAIAAHEAVRALRPSEECDAFLRRLLEAYPRYTIANVFSRDGSAICSPMPEGMARVNVGDRWYFGEVLRTGRFTIGTYAVGRATGAASLHLAAPLLDEDGTVRAVLVLGLSVPWMVQDLLALDLPEGASSTIADREGTILARSQDPAGFVGRKMAPFAMELLNRPAAGVVYAPALDGVRRIAAYLPVNEAPQGLFITMGLDVQRALSAAAERDRLTALVILGSLLLTFAVALLGFSAAVERPVRALLGAAQRWSRQDWDARVGRIGGGAEFERLGAAFDAMAAEVQLRESARAATESRLSALLDLSPQVVMTADAAGQFTWLNRWWHEYTGCAHGQGLGTAWVEQVHPEDRDGMLATWKVALSRARAGEPVEFMQEMRLRHAATGLWRWHVARARPLRDPVGAVSGWVGVAVDVHEIHLARGAADAAAARLRATYEGAPVGLGLMDRELRFLAANSALAAMDGLPQDSYAGRTLEELHPAIAAQSMPALRAVAETGEGRDGVEVRVTLHGEERTRLCFYRPVRDAAGGVAGVACAVLDITERKQAEEAERRLSREVDHRAKNALAVVRSLARLSLAEAQGDAEAVVEALEGRISAMARAHTLLAENRWAGAELRALASGEVAELGGPATLDGPDLTLLPSAAQPLAMALHELAVNALRHGAVTQPDGRVAVSWRRTEDGGALITWRETGGPSPDPDTEPGFGLRLVEANLAGPLGGEARFDWRPEGLLCELRLGREALR